MITLHKLSGAAFVLNADLIETVESTPDTLITLVDRRRFMVAESVEDVVDAFTRYRRNVMNTPFMSGTMTAAEMAAS
ncbi:MAG: flagellar FlbD family protein [Actinobacteria bacterium]|nr:flagellar FlbD family protein [Thermoleophilia bacterium]MCB9010645.1 flagellar FlbD family protein [Actinomycetota bacterium]